MTYQVPINPATGEPIGMAVLVNPDNNLPFDAANPLPLLLPDTSVTGTVTNDNDTVSIALPGGQATVLIQITGTSLGTLLFEASPDNSVTWYGINATQENSTKALSTNVAGLWRANVSGYTNFHVKLHPVGTNPATILLRLTSALQSVFISNATALGQVPMNASAPVVLASDQPGLSQMATSDGIAIAKVLAEALYLYSGGGPVDSTGKPQQLSLDRIKSLQGKQGTSGTITTTVAGDANLTFSVAPKTIMPGQSIMLQGATTVESVLVSLAYVPSSTATVIPLQDNVVQAGHTTAKWSIFNASGPSTNAVYPDGVLPVVNLIQDLSNSSNAVVSSLWMPTGGNVDAVTPRYLPGSQPFLFNGTASDRERGNLDNIALVASAAYTTTQTSADQVNYNGRGVIVILDTTVASTGSVTLEIDMKDPVSGKYIALLTGAAVTTVSTNIYTVYPGAPATANVSANSPLPRTWHVKVVANNANTQTYSVGAAVIR